MSINIRNKDDKAYIVFGFPHSATSFVAKMLKSAGVDIGTNMQGLYQSWSVTKINTKILKKAGGSWDNPPSEKDIMEAGYDREIKEVINEKKSKFWAMKDPRFSLTLKKWLPHIKGDTYLICCFRKPEKIIKSYKKDKIKVSKKLIDRYNKSIIGIIKEFCDL